jgi:hypothetical protein
MGGAYLLQGRCLCSLQHFCFCGPIKSRQFRKRKLLTVFFTSVFQGILTFQQLFSSTLVIKMETGYTSVNKANGKIEIVKIPDILLGNHNVETMKDVQRKFCEYFTFLDHLTAMKANSEQVQPQTKEDSVVPKPIYRELKTTPKKKCTLNNQQAVWSNLKNH